MRARIALFAGGSVVVGKHGLPPLLSKRSRRLQTH